jgi:hypothetical protein
MNMQQQIDIIEAHRAGKQVMSTEDAPEGSRRWYPLAKGEHQFNFVNYQYKLEPRKIESFMMMPSGILKAISRPPTVGCSASAKVWLGNTAPSEIPDGHVVVKITYLEP